MKSGYTDTIELICPNCGDRQYLDYSEVSPQLQRLRGPRTLEAASQRMTSTPGCSPHRGRAKTEAPRRRCGIKHAWDAARRNRRRIPARGSLVPCIAEFLTATTTFSRWITWIPV
jgi:hypothetical protein